MPDRPAPGSVEERAVTEGAPEVEGRRLRGVIPYSVESRDLGGFREVIEPGALAGADLSDLIVTREHDRSKLLGRYPTTLTTEDRADGFAWSVELPQSSVGEDVRVAIERGDLRATSWRMVVGRDRWDGNVRHVEAISELRDVCVTAAPAYGEARAEYRAAPEPEPPPLSVPEPKEAPVPPDETPAGGLRVEDRAASSEDHPTVESRVLDAIRSVRKGESRSLTTTNAEPIAPPELATFLWDRLRPASIALASGIRVVPTDKQMVTWPRVLSDVDPTWVAETNVIPAGDPTFGQLSAEPKKLAHRTELSNEVIDDSEPSILDVLNGHLALMLALKLDRAIFEGNPATDPISIRGLKYVSGTQTIDMGTNGAALTNYDPFVRAVGLLRSANVPGPYAIAAHPRTLTALELLKEATASAMQLGAPAALPPFFVSSQLSVTEAKGTSSDTSSAFVYAPSEVVLVRRKDAEIELDRSRLFDRDMSELRAKLRADLIVPNPVAVVRITGIAA
jgi:HK97 family phage major capsid protein/HK97 family phage prohead protease